MKFTRNDRTIEVSDIPVSHEIPNHRMEIEVRYAETADALRAVALDHAILPLIAAAPEMLAALDEADTAMAVCNICDDLTPQARQAVKRAWAAINAAMASATGRPDPFAEANPEIAADESRRRATRDAAPELLSAIQSLVAWVDENRLSNTTPMKTTCFRPSQATELPVVSAARAAIAKARGASS